MKYLGRLFNIVGHRPPMQEAYRIHAFFVYFSFPSNLLFLLIGIASRFFLWNAKNDFKWAIIISTAKFYQQFLQESEKMRKMPQNVKVSVSPHPLKHIFFFIIWRMSRLFIRLYFMNISCGSCDFYVYVKILISRPKLLWDVLTRWRLVKTSA